MSLLQERTNRTNEVLEGKFIRKSLHETGTDIVKEQAKRMANFKQGFWKNVVFTVTDKQLDFTFDTRHRFADMKTRKSKKGKNKKKSYPIYNKVIFSKYNYLIRELTFGYTDAVKDELRQLSD
jgi:hypothetical protein